MHKRTLDLCGKPKKGKNMMRVDTQYINKITCFRNIANGAHYFQKDLKARELYPKERYKGLAS